MASNSLIFENQFTVVRSVSTVTVASGRIAPTVHTGSDVGSDGVQVGGSCGRGSGVAARTGHELSRSSGQCRSLSAGVHPAGGQAAPQQRAHQVRIAPATPTYTWGEMTSRNLWSLHVRRLVGITWNNV